MKKFLSYAAVIVAVCSNSMVFAAGDAAMGKNKAAACAGCHGADGNSIVPNFPSLAGQNEGYLIKQMSDFKKGDRKDASMSPQVAHLSDQDMADIAAYFAEQPVAVRGADPDLAASGERIYRAGIPERGIAACIACHGPSGKGNPMAGYPRLGHQHAADLRRTAKVQRVDRGDLKLLGGQPLGRGETQLEKVARLQVPRVLGLGRRFVAAPAEQLTKHWTTPRRAWRGCAP